MSEVDKPNKLRPLVPYFCGLVAFVFFWLFWDRGEALRLYYSFFWGVGIFLISSHPGEKIWKFSTWGFFYFYVPWVFFDFSLTSSLTRQFVAVFETHGIERGFELSVSAALGLFLFFAVYFFIERFKLNWISFGSSAILSTYVMSLYQSRVIVQNAVSPSATVFILFIGVSLMFSMFKNSLFKSGKQMLEKKYDESEKKPTPPQFVFEDADLSGNSTFPQAQSNSSSLNGDTVDIAVKIANSDKKDIAPEPARKVFVPISMDEGPETYAEQVDNDAFEAEDSSGNFSKFVPDENSTSKSSSPEEKEDSLDNQLEEIGEDFTEERKLLLDSIQDLRAGEISASELYERFSSASGSVYDSVISESGDFILLNMKRSIDNGDGPKDVVASIEANLAALKREHNSDRTQVSEVSSRAPSNVPLAPASALVAEISRSVSSDDVEEILPISDGDNLKNLYKETMGSVKTNSSQKDRWIAFSKIIEDGLFTTMDRPDFDSIVSEGILSNPDDPEASSSINSFLILLKNFDGTELKAKRTLPILWSLVGQNVNSVKDEGAFAFSYYVNQIADNHLFSADGMSRKKYLMKLILCLSVKELQAAVERATYFAKNGIADLDDQDEAKELGTLFELIYAVIDADNFVFDETQSLKDALAFVRSEADKQLAVIRMISEEGAPYSDEGEDDEDDATAADKAKSYAMYMVLTPHLQSLFNKLAGSLQSVKILEDRIDADGLSRSSSSDSLPKRENNRVYPILQQLKKEAISCIDEVDDEYKNEANLSFILFGIDKNLPEILERLRETREEILNWSSPEDRLNDKIRSLKEEIEANSKEKDEVVSDLQTSISQLNKRLAHNHVDLAVLDIARLIREKTNSIFEFSDPKESAVRLWYERSSTVGEVVTSKAFCVAFIHGSNQPWTIKDGSFLHCSKLATTISLYELAMSCADSTIFSMYDEVYVRVILVGASSFDAKSDRMVYQMESIMLDDSGSILKALLHHQSNLGDVVRTEKSVKVNIEPMTRN